MPHVSAVLRFVLISSGFIRKALSISWECLVLSLRNALPENTVTSGMHACLQLLLVLCCVLSANSAGMRTAYNSVYEDIASGLEWMQELRK